MSKKNATFGQGMIVGAISTLLVMSVIIWLRQILYDPGYMELYEETEVGSKEVELISKIGETGLKFSIGYNDNGDGKYYHLSDGFMGITGYKVVDETIVDKYRD